MRRRGEHVNLSAQVPHDRLVGTNPALGEPELPELHRARGEEDEVREPKAVPAALFVPSCALVDYVEQLGQRVERGAWLGGPSRSWGVHGGDEAKIVRADKSGEDDVEFASGDLELDFYVGRAGVGELDSYDGVSMREQAGVLAANLVALGSSNGEGESTKENLSAHPSGTLGVSRLSKES